MLMVGLALMMGIGVAHADTINGGFETGDFSGWTTSGLTCSAVGTGYSTATGCYGYDTDPGPHSGQFAAYLGTAAGGGVVSQSLNTVAGQTYQLNFFLANGSYQGTATPNDFLVEWNGATVLHLADSSTFGFTQYTYDVVATGASTTLAFTNKQTPSFWVLDDISVRAVPEPFSVTLIGFGLAGIGVLMRRKAQ
jgi:hypothetical protein